MKNIRCFILALISFLSTLSMDAQTAAKIGKGSIGFQAGINFQSINGRDINGDKLTSDAFTGYHAGLIADLKIAPGFFFQTGLLYTVKGAKNYAIALSPGAPVSAKIDYLELPLQFVVKPILGNGHLLLGLGSYVGYGLGGHAKFMFEGVEMKKNVFFQNEVSASDAANEVYLRRMDAGLSMLVGYEFATGLFLQLNSQLGLTKINPRFSERVNDRSLAQHNGFGLTIGYRL